MKFKSQFTERLDVFLARELAVSRSLAQKIIEAGGVKVDGNHVTRKAHLLVPGSEIEVDDEVLKKFKEGIKIRFSERHDIPFQTIYEDDEFLVISKPAGVVVHPTKAHPDDTLVQVIFSKIDFPVPREVVLKEGVEIRPGIVHRLDREVSGVILVAKNPIALDRASREFAERRVKKRYLAVAWGHTVKKEGRIDLPIARAGGNLMKVSPEGKEAITIWKNLASLKNPPLTFFELKPITGRTHQIRVHLSATGHPIVGDRKYGGAGRKFEKLVEKVGVKLPEDAILLHAFELEIFGKRFRAPLPDYFKKFLVKVFGDDVLKKASLEDRS